MKKGIALIILVIGLSQISVAQKKSKNIFPDGTKIPAWFNDASKIKLEKLSY